ncbi:MAG: spore coat protein [Bacilli bacterium]|nr:spore coat protein [Bacilli bacterium]
MNNKKIECKMKEVPSTKEMNDKDILNDVLLTLKNVSNNYSIAIDEMSNKYLFKEVFKIFNETKNKAREAYELAFNNGWYSLEEAEEQKINQALTKMNKSKKELD